MGRNSRAEFTPTKDGTYFAAVGQYVGQEGAYTLSVTDLTDIAADTGTTGEITVGDCDAGLHQFGGRRGLVCGRAGGGEDLPRKNHQGGRKRLLLVA